ncbi:unnamed protein product [Notodromas monacha]|uniref:BTB domain-containing protein n=1 Tax=Notodromas monacha TaxID=399045 RepID=A0A7R9BBW0_9CRUS|nr:unnamed protein product [Notodromas monacha]CAG0912447.1 unnamed protein product [Notodromas monacha]
MKEVRDRKSAGEQQNHHPHREEAASSSSLSSSLSSVAQGMTIGDGATTSPSESSSPSSLLLCEPGGLERKCPTLPSPSGNVTHVVIGTQGAAVHVQHVGAEYGSFTQHQYSGDVQSLKPTLRERNAAMFDNELMSDVVFVVGPPSACQRIFAHKYVLATGSAVFFAMFHGGLAETKLEIAVPDVDPLAFRTLLRYLYMDDTQMKADVVLSTLYAAKKYMVPFLARACVAFLERSLTAENACVLLSQARLLDEPDLTQRCWEVVDAQAEMALTADGLADVDHATLNTATKKYENNDDAVAQRLRRVLGDAVFLIRFPAMSLDEFANEAAQSGVLTLQETKDVFLHLTATQKPALRFCAVPRRGLQAQVCHRFGSCAYRSNQWRYRGRCDSIQFCVDKRVFVVGFGLYGSSNGAAEYSVRMELKRGGSNGDGCSGASSSSSSSSPPPLLGECVTKLVSDGSSNTFHVHFPHPIQIEADQYYTASCVLDGGELSYFGQEGMSEVQAGCVTFQFQCSVDSTNGTGVQGGQIPEIIFYGPSSSASPPLP